MTDVNNNCVVSETNDSASYDSTFFTSFVTSSARSAANSCSSEFSASKLASSSSHWMVPIPANLVSCKFIKLVNSYCMSAHRTHLLNIWLNRYHGGPKVN